MENHRQFSPRCTTNPHRALPLGGTACHGVDRGYIAVVNRGHCHGCRPVMRIARATAFNWLTMGAVAAHYG